MLPRSSLWLAANSLGAGTALNRQAKAKQVASVYLNILNIVQYIMYGIDALASYIMNDICSLDIGLRFVLDEAFAFVGAGHHSELSLEGPAAQVSDWCP